jgi:hypothetical protein
VFETESNCNEFLDIAQGEQRKAFAAAKKAQLVRQQAQPRGSQS